jgi:hypothetical protein
MNHEVNKLQAPLDNGYIHMTIDNNNPQEGRRYGGDSLAAQSAPLLPTATGKRRSTTSFQFVHVASHSYH